MDRLFRPLTTRPSAAAFAVSFLLLFSLFLWGEKIAFQGGLGMDGYRYVRLATRFWELVGTSELTDADLQRVLPSLVIYLFLRPLGATTDIAALTAFGLLNSVALASTISLFVRTAFALHVQPRAVWAGGTLSFVSFAFLKWPSYYPALTDSCAVFAGAVLLHAHLTGRIFLVGIATVAAFFVWPTAGYMGLLFLTFPRRIPLPVAMAPDKAIDLARLFGALAIATGLWVTSFNLLTAWNYALGNAHVAPVNMALFPIAVAFQISFFTASSYFLLPPIGPKLALSTMASVRLTWVAVAVAIDFGVPYIRELIAGRPIPASDVGWQNLRLILTLPYVAPGRPLVAHMAFFGLVVMAAIIYWPRICRTAHQLGVGVTGALALALLQSMGPDHGTSFTICRYWRFSLLEGHPGGRLGSRLSVAHAGCRVSRRSLVQGVASDRRGAVRRRPARPAGQGLLFHPGSVHAA